MNLDIRDKHGNRVDFDSLDLETQLEVSTMEINWNVAFRAGYDAALAAVAAAEPAKAAPAQVPAPQPVNIRLELGDGMKIVSDSLAITSMPSRVTSRVVKRDQRTGHITETVDVEEDLSA